MHLLWNNTYLRSNSLRSTERKLFSLYTNANSYKDNTEFDGLVAQAIKHDPCIGAYSYGTWSFQLDISTNETSRVHVAHS